MRFPECFSKRLFLSLVISAVCLGLAASFVVRRGTATAGGPNFVYANNDLSGTNSVTAFEVGADGTLTNIGTFATGGSGGGSALGANRATVTVVGSFLYASNTASGDITAFSINSNSGSLTFLSTFSTGQKNNGPIGLAATPNGRFLIASNDLARSISVFGIGADGALVGPEANIAVPGQPDSIRLSPSGNVLAVTFNASRTIAMYTVDNNGNLSPAPGSPFSVSSPTTGRRTKSIDAGGSAAASISAIGINRTGTLLFAAVTNTPGVQTIEAFNIGGEGNLTKIAGSPFQYNASASGIENLAISPDGKHLYISSQSGQVTPYDALPDGTLVPNFTGAASLPGASFAAGMAMDRSGTFLFASGAGDSVVVNRIGQDGGLTTLTAQSASSSVSNQTTSGRSLAAFPSGDVVNAGTTVSTTTLSSGTPNPSTFGNPITFVATVTGSGPTPTGTVQFTVDGHPNQFSATLDGTGKATATVTLNNVFTGGTHSVIANYLGDATYAPSDSTAVTQTVNTISSSTALTSSVNPTVFGQSTTFTATVTAAAGTPTGTVTFKNGSTTLGTGTLNGSGVATFTTSSLAVGTNSITAVFGGDTNTTTSTSAAVPQVVNKANATASTVTSTVNPSVFGQSTTFSTTVTASAPGAGTPTGTVQFMDGATPLGSPVTVNGSGVATLAVTSLTVGSHTISAVYSGDANFNGTTAPSVTQVVNQAPNSTTTVTSSVNPTVFGQSTTFTATVAAVAPATGTPTGTVDFKDNGTTIGTGTLNGSGVATFATSALSVGNHPITAVFNGDANFPTSTGTLTNGQTVNKAASSTAVTSSTSPSVFGQSTTFTATVTATSPGAGTPTGTVTFKDGTTTLGTGTLNGSGVATFATSALTPGNHTITAVFGGDGNFTTSTGTLTNGQTVNTAATSTALTSSVNPTVFGQSTTFTATVTATAPGAGTPTGTVTFKDGTTTLGTGTLNGSGVAT
ncbi:MAG TPA: Ig-like domain repeat protein, partial [Blastocatellia bacterium]|nr:Ig-like domain repeat protein [Blastocatellia bacterium]